MMKILKERTEKLVFFLLKFNVFAIPLYLFSYLNFSFLQLQSFLASSISKILSFLGYQAFSENFFITLAHSYEMAKIEINFDCTGWKSMLLLTALTFATPSEIFKKTKFLLISLPFLFSLNFVRILTTLIFSLHFGFDYLSIIHTFLWREGLIFAAILIWYIWLRKKT